MSEMNDEQMIAAQKGTIAKLSGERYVLLKHIEKAISMMEESGANERECAVFATLYTAVFPTRTSH